MEKGGGGKVTKFVETFFFRVNNMKESTCIRDFGVVWVCKCVCRERGWVKEGVT
jgi:hypothetical protein